jgi:predicted RNase H-like nuclease (RuvC/YqgF family)
MITKDDEIEFLNDQLDYMAKELKEEKAFNKALQADKDRLNDLLNNSENNVKRVSLLMSELKLNWSM